MYLELCTRDTCSLGTIFLRKNCPIGFKRQPNRPGFLPARFPLSGSLGKVPLSSVEDSLGLIFPDFFLDILPECL